MKIALATDHAGADMRPAILETLKAEGHEVIDFGAHGSESVDYPDYAEKACLAVTSGRAERAILVCGTGIGMSIAANKIPGIRCALCASENDAQMARLHNDANCLALRGRNADTALLQRMVGIFVGTAYENGRHQRRLDKIRSLEGKREGQG